MSLLGIDVGTTGCKAVAFSAEGDCLCNAYREYPAAAAAACADACMLDSKLVVSLVKETIRQAAKETSTDPITALCVSSMGEAMTPIGADGEILDGCILCSDTRGGDLLNEAMDGLGQTDFFKINPNILGANYSLPKLLWIKANQPELYEKTDKFLLWCDLIAHVLGCEPVTSYSLANRTLLFDIHTLDWSDALLERSQIDKDKLPRCAPSGTVVGTVSDSVAQELSLPKGVKVVLGGHDQGCNSLGAGICTAGRAVCGIGTFECITPTFDHIPPAEKMLSAGMAVEHHLLDGLYVTLIYNQAGRLVKWFRDTFAQADMQLCGPDKDIYDLLAAEMPAEPTDLITLPYFEPTGPPNFISKASGAVIGMKTSTTRGEILKSIMECTTLYFMDCIEALASVGVDTSEFVATGGGANNDQWLQIKADVFNVPFIRPAITDASPLGAALLAGVATGVYADAAEGVERMVRHEKVFRPNPTAHQQYRDKLHRYRQVTDAMLPLMQEM